MAYACLAVVSTAGCLWWDAKSGGGGGGGGWSSAGTAVTAQSPTGVTCSTLHTGPGLHAVRFAALPQQQADIFAARAPLAVRTTVSLSWATMACMAVGLGVGAAGAACAARARRTRAWAEALEQENPLAHKRTLAAAAAAPAHKVWDA